MAQFTDSGADVPLVSGATRPQRKPVRHLIFGSLAAVQLTIKTLHKKGYAEPNDWSKPIPTGRVGEVMAILVKHLWVD